MSTALAKQTCDERAQVGGFSSVEDLGLLLDLPPATVDQMPGRLRARLSPG
jgi:DNA uptake protein ComE-like DNA-binding protein